MKIILILIIIMEEKNKEVSENKLITQGNIIYNVSLKDPRKRIMHLPLLNYEIDKSQIDKTKEEEFQRRDDEVRYKKTNI